MFQQKAFWPGSVPFFPALLVLVSLASMGVYAADPRELETGAEDAKPAPTPQVWSLHIQNTDIVQGVTGFVSPYAGENSLTPRQTRETITLTVFFAVQLWKNAILVINPEYAQGQGLNTTHGVAGFPNGEATKAGSLKGKLDIERLYFSQIIDFGGEQEVVSSGRNQLAGKRDISRLTLTIGKCASNDFFDDNTFAHDPRSQFINWSIWESAAWDFPSDAKGYTIGTAVELNQKTWALRYGAFLLPRVANGLALQSNPARALAQVVEFERRYTVWGDRIGKLRLLAYANHANMGRYRDAVNQFLANPSTGPADITPSRASRWKYGGAISLEQELTAEIGAFLRLSLNDGATESWAFTEVDRSAAVGVSVKGTRWSHSSDTVGLAFALNDLSGAHRDYLAAGGLGILLGDGRLRYRPEKVLECYYDAKLPIRYTNLMVGYQLVNAPGYNSQRGPANIFTARIHFEY